MRMTKSTEKLTCQDTLKRLGKFTLERRQIRGDMIKELQTTNSRENGDRTLFFWACNTRTRGQSTKMKFVKFKTDKSKYLFT